MTGTGGHVTAHVKWQAYLLFSSLLMCLLWVIVCGCGNAEKRKSTHYQKGAIFFQRGRYSEAVEEFQKALSIDPAMGEAHLELGRSFCSLGLYDQAVLSLEEAKRVNARLALPALSEIAGIYFETERFALAEQIGMRALKMNPDHADVLLLLGKLHWKQERPGEALVWLRKAAAAAPKAVEPRIMLAEIHMRQGNYAEAEESLKIIIEDIDSHDTAAQLGLAKVLRLTHRTEQAIELLLHILEQEPANVAALGALAESYYSTNQLEKARQLAETFVSVSPGNPHASSLFGTILLKEGEYEQAVVYLTRASVAPSATAEDYYALGLALQQIGKPAQAIIAFQKALTVDPDYLPARLALSEAFLEEGSFEKALHELELLLAAGRRNQSERPLEMHLNALQRILVHIEELRAKGAIPAEIAEAFISALTASKNDDLTSVRLVCEELLKENPASTVALNLLGLIHLKQNDFERALAFFQSASDADPRFAASHVNMADAYMAIGAYSAAACSLQEAISLSPKNYTLRLGYIKTLNAMKNYQEAERRLRDLIMEQPAEISYRHALAELLIDSKKYEEARRELSFILRSNPQDSTAAMLMAECLAKEGDLWRAADHFAGLAEASPHDNLFPARLALCHLALGMPAEAREALSRSGNHSSSLAWALLLQHEGRYEEAERVLLNLQEDPVKENPCEIMILNLRRLQEKGNARPECAGISDFSRAFYQSYKKILDDEHLNANQMFELNLSLALLRIGWSVAGLERLEQFIAKNGPNAALLEMSGNAWEEEGQPARARRHYEDAVAAEPEYWPAYYRLGLLAAAEGRPEAAIVCFQTVLRSQQTLLPVFLDLAKAYEAAGNDAEALGVYQTAHRLFPDHPQVVNNLAWLLAKNPETLDSALQHAQAAVSIQPLSAAARDTLGWIYFQKEDFAEAHAQLNKAVLLDAYNPSIRYHRGMASWKLGEAERALRDFQKAESSALPYPEKELAQKMIKRTLRRPNAPAEPQTPGPARTASSLRPPQEAC